MTGPGQDDRRDGPTPATTVHANPWFAVSHREDPATLGGAGWFRVERDDSAVVVPVLDDGSVVFVSGTRDTTGDRIVFELPAGGIEPGEAPATAAARELEEETGYLADVLEPIGVFVEAPGISAARCHVFRATGLRERGQQLEPGESWTPTPVSPARATALVRNGDVVDGGSIAALTLYRLRETDG